MLIAEYFVWSCEYIKEVKDKHARIVFRPSNQCFMFLMNYTKNWFEL